MQLYVGAKAVMIQNGKVLLTREAHYDEGKELGKWDMPGGRLEEGETVYAALKREVKEEVGLVVENVAEVLGVFDAFPTIKGQPCHIVRIYFLVDAFSGEVALSSDHDKYDWVNPHEPGDKQLMTEIPEMLAASQQFV